MPTALPAPGAGSAATASRSTFSSERRRFSAVGTGTVVEHNTRRHIPTAGSYVRGQSKLHEIGDAGNPDGTLGIEGCGAAIDLIATKRPPPQQRRINQMSPAVCSFCSHANPHGSAYCNECGAALKLMLCKACGAINDRTAANCHKCGVELWAASPLQTTLEQTSHAEAYDPPTEPIALAAAPSAVDEPEPFDPGVRSTWPQRRLSPAVMVFSLCALGAVSYYAYQRGETTPTMSATPADSVTTPEISAKTSGSEAPRDEPEQRPANGSTIVAEIPARAPDLASPAEDEPAPTTTEAGSNDATQQPQLQAAPEEAPTPQATTSTAPSRRTDRHQPQKERNVKRDNSLASSKPSSDALIAPWAARPSTQRVETNLRPPAACTDAGAALALCSRSNPDQGK